jgi:DnaK suppressor protein
VCEKKTWARQTFRQINTKEIRTDMDQETQHKFKKQLEEMAEELRASVNKTDATDAVQLDTSIGRLSRMDAMQSQQMAIALKARQQQSLTRVENALETIRNGTYGQCRRCKKPIAIERLEGQPDAFLCVECASEIGKR